MSRYDRREAAVRELLESGHTPLPPGLCAASVRRGRRLARRRAVARRVLWALVFAAVVAFTVWAAVARPWVEPPSEITPPLTGW
ncbi:hypothetical protein [Streptomyces sp. NPDC058045]|uniref:hypothetical protein n=1 Tax=Streptomyces sp. NPDC058045 TaxID=3346311 RepID=UPI0036EBA9B3